MDNMTIGYSEQQLQQSISLLEELVVTGGLRTCSSKETAHISKSCCHLKNVYIDSCALSGLKYLVWG